MVLIDEYDKPILDVLDTGLETVVGENRMSLEDRNRNVLKGFYSVFKAADEHLQFVFLTGVTKFSQVSVFSGFNQPIDISMNPRYEALCGITQEELDNYFMGSIAGMAEIYRQDAEGMRQMLKRQYDGYHFCEDTTVGLFNPFSVLNALQKLKLGNYWFQTGTPTYLVDLLKQSDYDLRLLINGIETTNSAFSEYRAEANNPLPMIYQSGYLTIKHYDKEVDLYTLKFPNDEVCYGFLNFLVPNYTNVSDDETGFHIAKFIRELRSGDIEAFMERLKVFFAGMPYELSENTERHYQAIFYVVFTLMGQFVETEVRSARGRADAVVKTKDFIFVFEFKLNGTAEEALKQIDEKGYLIPYTLDGRKLVKVGVNFSKEKRNIDCYVIG